MQDNCALNRIEESLLHKYTHNAAMGKTKNNNSSDTTISIVKFVFFFFFFGRLFRILVEPLLKKTINMRMRGSHFSGARFHAKKSREYY